ncbi:MAG: hypothetical protein ACI4PO_07490 [Faecousia sp.]
MRNSCWNEADLNAFHGYLYTVNNGKMDVEGFLDSPYGQELANRLQIRARIQEDHEKAKEYYASIGLTKEYHDWEDYYTRWTLLVPMERREKMPLLIYLHGGGNSIEAEENMTGFAQIAAKEGFLLACPQNTNPEKVESIIEVVGNRYPLDESRIYLAGFSQGGAQTHASYFRHPERFAGAVTSGDSIWNPWDVFEEKYTEAELEKTRQCVIPLMMLCGQCEPFAYAPLNDYRPTPFGTNGKPWGSPDTFSNVGMDFDLDPTRIHDLSKGKFDAAFGKPEAHKWRTARKLVPTPEEDPGRWNLNRVNTRMRLLGCQERDVEKCLSFRSLHQDELHYITGIYGDTETIDYHYGYRHYTVGINGAGNREVFRFVVVQNSPHWPPLAMGELGWNFLKKYRRDTNTGKLIMEE